MVINTRDFGQIEIDESDILRFPEGLYGFEDVHEYVLLEPDEGHSPILYMQAVHSEYPSFIVVDPYFIDEQYDPQVPQDILQALKADSRDMLRFLAIAVIPQNIRDMTVNMKSPIVINISNKLAMQVILDESPYLVRQRVFE